MTIRDLRIADLIALVRREGVTGITRRVVRSVYRRLDVEALDATIHPSDLADSRRLPPREPSVSRNTAGPRRIGWICMPPGPGSGGHTTLFRMVAGFEDRGDSCTLFLYDPKGGDITRHAATIRKHWPSLAADIRDVREGFDGLDAIIASSWETAHVLIGRGGDVPARLYFVQDFEPMFHPRGSLYALAEDSYRFGLRTIALGDMVASELSAREIDVDVAPFGCDTEVYHPTGEHTRSGVIFYVKPDNDRRGYLLGKQALALFHERHPEQEIHIYGDVVSDWTIPVTHHRRLSPLELNELYNRTIGGLALSFTNISLVAEEMLAAGAIPVVNDSPLARADLPNTEAVWAAPTPSGLADALCTVVEAPDVTERAARAFGQVREGWGPAQNVTIRVVEDELARVSRDTTTDASARERRPLLISTSDATPASTGAP